MITVERAARVRATGPRERTRAEEVANSISHGVGVGAATVAVPVLVSAALRSGDPWSITSATVFGASMVLLFAASSLYHGLPGGRAKRFFEFVDNAAVFLLIAGTYTPFTLLVIRGTLGWTLFGLVWGLALIGVAVILLGDLRFPVLTVGLCLLMGWLGIVALRVLLQRLPEGGLALLLAGGVAYTVGVAFYAARRMRYHHLIWHVLVLVGTTCHFLSIYWYVV
jgi:hemolysin III